MSLDRGGGSNRGGRGRGSSNSQRGRGAPTFNNTSRGGANTRGKYRGGSDSFKASSTGPRSNEAAQKAMRQQKFGTAPQADGADTAKSFDERLEELKDNREIERASAIRQGLLADPEKPTTLANAIVPVGTCKDMCPEFERVQRVCQNDLWAEETDFSTPADVKGRRQPFEHRMVKKFKRAAAGNEEQIPSDLRPPLVLKATCDFLFEDFLPSLPIAKAHNFIWDRTRAVRNDFSIQQVSSEEDVRTAVECYERITRFHIHALHELATLEPAHAKYDRKGELQMLDKTLLSLLQYYDDFRHTIDFTYEAEFRAYHIIFQIQNPTLGIAEKAQTWDQYLLQQPRVKAALELWAKSQNAQDRKGPMNPHVAPIFAREDFAGFWSAVSDKQTSYLEACMAECYFNHIRFHTLQSLIDPPGKAERSSAGVSEAELLELLAFDTVADLTKYLGSGGITMMQRDGVNFLDPAAVKRSGVLNKFAALPVLKTGWVDSKRGGRSAAAVINGLKVREAEEIGMIDGMSDDGESLFIPETKAFPSSTPANKPPVNGFNAFQSDQKPSTSTFGQPSVGRPSPFADINASNDTATTSATTPNLSFGRSSPSGTFSGSGNVPAAPVIDFTQAGAGQAGTSKSIFGSDSASVKSGSTFGQPSTGKPTQFTGTFGQPSSGGTFGQPSKMQETTAASQSPFAAFNTQNPQAETSSGSSGKPSQGFNFSKPSTSGVAFKGPTVNGMSSLPFPAKDASSTLGGATTPMFKTNFGSGTGGFGSPTGDTTSMQKESTAAGPVSPLGDMFKFDAQKSATDASKTDSNGKPASPVSSGPGTFKFPANGFGAQQTASAQWGNAQTAVQKAAHESQPTNGGFNLGQAAGVSSLGSMPSNAEAQPAQPHLPSSAFQFPSAASQPSSSPTSPPTMPARPPSFSESKHQPKKPSPLSRSYTASEDASASKLQLAGSGPAPQGANAPFPSQASMGKTPAAQRPAPLAVTKPDPDAIISRVARELTLDPDYGILQQWIEHEISTVITASQKKVGLERDNAAADHFRKEKVAGRFGRKWRSIWWHNRLKRKGRELRQRTRESHMRHSQGAASVGRPIEESPFSNSSMARSTSVRGSRKRKVSEREEVDRDFQLSTIHLERREKPVREEESELPNKRPTSSHGAGTTAVSKASTHKRYKSTSHIGESGRITKPTAAAESVAESQAIDLRRSAFLRYRRTGADAPKRQTTSNYFRLKAMGIKPEMQLGYSTRSSQKNSTQDSTPLPSAPVSGKRRRSETLSLTPEGTPIPSREAHVPLEPISSPRDSPSNKLAKFEEVDDTFTARMKATLAHITDPAQDNFVEGEPQSPELSSSINSLDDSPAMVLARHEARKRASKPKATLKPVPRYVARESRFLRKDDSASSSIVRSRDSERAHSKGSIRSESRVQDRSKVVNEEFSPDKPTHEPPNGLPTAPSFGAFTQSQPEVAGDDYPMGIPETNTAHTQQGAGPSHEAVSPTPASSFALPTFGSGFGTGPANALSGGFGQAAAFGKSSTQNPASSNPFSLMNQASSITSFGAQPQQASPNPFGAFSGMANDVTKPSVNAREDHNAEQRLGTFDSQSQLEGPAAEALSSFAQMPQTAQSQAPKIPQLASLAAMSEHLKTQTPPGQSRHLSMHETNSTANWTPSFSQTGTQPNPGFDAVKPAPFSQGLSQPSFGFGFHSRPMEVPETQDRTIQPTQISQSLRHSFGAPQAFHSMPNGTEDKINTQTEVIDLQESDDEVDSAGQSLEPAMAQKPDGASQSRKASSDEDAGESGMRSNPYAALANYDDGNGDASEDAGSTSLAEDEAAEEVSEQEGQSDAADKIGYKDRFARASHVYANGTQEDSYLHDDYDSVGHEDVDEDEEESVDEDETPKPVLSNSRYGANYSYNRQYGDDHARGDEGMDDGMEYDGEDEELEGYDEDEDGEEGTEFDSQYDSEDEEDEDEAPDQRYAASIPDKYGRVPSPPPNPAMGGDTQDDAIELSD